MPVFYSPKGNPEIWKTKPNGYFTEQEWADHNKPTQEELETQEIVRVQQESEWAILRSVKDTAIQTGAFTSAEFSLFAKAGLFTEWAAGQTYSNGYRLAHKGIVYEVMQEVTAIEDQPPDASGMLAVYRPLSVGPETGEEPDGSREHPYTFLYGMDVERDKYYSYADKLYLAKSDMPACVWPPDTEGLWQWELVE